MNGFLQGFRLVASFGFRGQESTLFHGLWLTDRKRKCPVSHRIREGHVLLIFNVLPYKPSIGLCIFKPTPETTPSF